MRRQVMPAIRILLVFTVLLGLAYPLAMTGIARGLFNPEANGSLVKRNGRTVGSKLIGQSFAKPQYFHPRPSAAGTNGYDGTASAGSNLGPANRELINSVKQRAAAYRKENELAPNTLVPVDAVTASFSGLDPQISVANARLQTPRVARARGMSTAAVTRLVDAHTTRRTFGVLGEDAVNVLQLNLALDASR
ncbi:MAG TPA: potassium-transporting ATPase subunit KdpC [Acidimicrobiia bacterium]